MMSRRSIAVQIRPLREITKLILSPNSVMIEIDRPLTVDQ